MKSKIFTRTMTAILSLVMILSLAPFAIFTGSAAEGDTVVTIPVTLWDYSDKFKKDKTERTVQYDAAVGDINELTVKAAIDLIKAEGTLANGIYEHPTYGTVNTTTGACQLNCMVFSSGSPDTKSYTFVTGEGQTTETNVAGDIASTSYTADVPTATQTNFATTGSTNAIDDITDTYYYSTRNSTSCSYDIAWDNNYTTTATTSVTVMVRRGRNTSGTVDVTLGSFTQQFNITNASTTFTFTLADIPADVSFNTLSISVDGLNSNTSRTESNRFGISEISVTNTKTVTNTAPTETYSVTFDWVVNQEKPTRSSFWTGNSSNGTGNKAKIYSGLAASTLDANNNIVLNLPNAGLFDTTDEENDGKTVYQNVAMQINYDVSTGYYSYNSSLQNLYFDPAALTLNLGAPYYGTDTIGGNNSGIKTSAGFFPFNEFDDSSNGGTADANFHFGAAVEIGFAMTPTGTVDGSENGEPITFVFSGDDDVYFYIDKKLTADLGGIHDAAAVYLNFKTNQIILFNPMSNNGDFMPGDVNTDYSGAEYTKYFYSTDADGNYTFTETTGTTYSAVQIGRIFNDANGNTGVLGVNIENFALQGEHTMRMYYIERGMGLSNLILRYNLAKQDTIEITKSINPNAISTDAQGNVTNTPLSDAAMGKLNNAAFKFELSYAIVDAQNNFYQKNADGTYTMLTATAGDPATRFSAAGKSYRIYNTTYSGTGTRTYTYVSSAIVDSASCVELKNNQTARFYDNMRFTGSVNGVDTDLFFVYYTAELGLDENAWATPSWVYSSNLDITAAPVEAPDSYLFMTRKKASDKETVFINFTYTNTYINNSASVNHELFAPDYGLMAVIDVLRNDYQSTNVNFIITGLSADAAPLAAGEYNSMLDTPEGTYTIERAIRYLIIDATTLSETEIAAFFPADRFIEQTGFDGPFAYKVEITEAEYADGAIRAALVEAIGEVITDSTEYTQVLVDEVTNELKDYCDALAADHNAEVPHLVIRFTPKTFLNTPVKVYYTLYTTLATVEQDVYSHSLVSTYLGVTPATVVNYEEDFGSLDENYEWVSPFTFTGEWNTYGDFSQTALQEQEGLLSGDPQSSIVYGYDPFVDLYQGDSLGSSMLSDGPVDLSTMSFEFTGTGFTIYGRTSEITGVIRVKYTDATGNTISKYIDTLYVGDYLDTAENVLYHIPVYMVQDLDYGTYTVELTVARQTKLYNNRYQFWFDGIDIYNPVNMNAAGADIAAAAYAADHALNPKIADVTDMIEGVKIQYSSPDMGSSADIYTDVKAYVPYSGDDVNAKVYKLAYETDKYLINDCSELDNGTVSPFIADNANEFYPSTYVNTAEGIVSYKNDAVYDGLDRYKFLVTEVTDAEERATLLSENKLWVINRFSSDATVSRLYGPKNEVYMVSGGYLNISLEGWNASLMVEGDEQVYLGIKTPNGVMANLTFSVYRNGAVDPEMIPFEIYNTTNAYFNVTDYVSEDDFIYIQVDAVEGSTSIVSFTSIIVTGNENFHLFDIPSENELNVEGANSETTMP